MKQEIRNNGEFNYTVLIASEGKVLKRKNSQDIFGKEIALGYSYYIDEMKLNEPHLDTVDDFEEIDEPEEDVFEEYEKITE